MLEDKGYVVIPFHAQGTGDRAMEELVADGVFDAVIDIVPAGVGEELLGGNRAAGECGKSRHPLDYCAVRVRCP
jgi:uncharacterized protein (UPF0261 family)